MVSHPLTQQLASGLASSTGAPVAHRIVETIWLAVVEGVLETGSRLPTTREVAIAVGVSPRAVERAYRQLEQRGVIATRPGEGTFVTLSAPSEEERARHQAFAELVRETVRRARELGYRVDDVIETLIDYRTLERESPQQEKQS